MRFRYIAAQNFGTLADVQLSLRRPPGLYFMTGRNLDRPKLGANGVGKSSIWRALYWNQFGVDPDGLKAGTLCGPRADKYGVRVGIDKNILTRHWNPIELCVETYGEGKVVTDFSAQQSLNQAEFKACILACQDGMTLLDYGPTERLNLVSSVLQLDRWNEFSSRAKELGSQREVRALNFGREVEILEAQLSELRLASPDKEIAEYEAKRAVLLKQGLQEIKDIKKARKEEQLKLKVKQQSVKLHEKSLSENTIRISALEANIASIERAHGRLIKDLMRLEADLGIQNATFKQLTESEGTCEVCGSELTGKKRDERIESVTVVAGTIAKKRDAVWASIREHESAKADFVKELAEHKSFAEIYGDKWDKENTWLTIAKNKVESLHEDLVNARARRATTAIAENPFTASNEKRLKRIRTIKASIAAHKSSQQTATRAAARAAWWINGFKDIRYMELENALGELTAIAQVQLIQMGMTGFRMEFIAQKEKKAGGMSNTFDVAIHAPKRKGNPPLAAFSGGERSRLKLASGFSLSDFLLRRRGLTSNIEVYDEPTVHLSPEGIDAVVELLKNRAIASKKQIWLVDHHAINSTAFMSTVMLEMKNGRTRIAE